MEFRDRYISWGKEAFGLDLRTLACVRMAFGVLVLLDLLVRSSALTAHYTDQGVIPLTLLHSTGLPFNFTLHGMSGSVGYIGILFLINALAAVALILGWRTRWATFLCWLLMLSLHNRNFLLLNGGDAWMRMSLAWAIFMPWGEKWSLDSRTVIQRQDNQVVTAATAGFCLQVFLVYIMAGLFKTGPAWWTEGSATHLTMGLSEWAGSLAHYMLYFPTLMKYLTFAILAYEIVGPFLLFAPIFTGYVRAFSVLGFVGFHLGLAIFIEIGFFPYVGMVAVSTLMPAVMWSTKPGQRLENLLDRLWSAPPQPRRNAPYHPNSLTHYVLSATIVYIFAWNAGSWEPKWGPPPKAQLPGHILRLDQYWALFAPEPPRHHNWFVVTATLSTGEQVDLLRDGKPVDWQCPTTSNVYGNQRIKRMLITLSNDLGTSSRESYLRYLYHRWENRFPDIQVITFYRLVQKTSLDYEEHPPHQVMVARMKRSEL